MTQVAGRSSILRIGFGLILLWITACSGNQATNSSNERVDRIVYGLTLEPSGFDPHINASSELGIPLRSVYDTLVYRNPIDGAFIPGLATEWTISPDGLIYTFRLREGVNFHDGTPFNAQAVADNFNRILDPNTASQKAAFMLNAYERYELIDDYNIRIVLREPYSPLLDALSQVYLGMASPTAFNQYSNERYQFHQVGTGAFRFVEYLPGERLVIRRNTEATWQPSYFSPVTDNSVDEVEFRFYSDPASRSIALESGEVQVMGELLPTDARTLASSGISVEPTSIAGQPLQFMFNTARFPTDNQLVRQALIFGTNRELIVDSVFQQFSPVAWGPISANTLYYNRQVVDSYGYDPTQARNLLEQAGLVDSDNNGYYDGENGDLELTLIVPGWGMIPEVAQLIQDQWRTIGIRAVLDASPSRSLVVEKVNAGEYNLVAFYSFGVDPAFINDYYLSDGSNNWMNYQNGDLDNLLLEASRQIDTTARATNYAQAQIIIMEQALILPIRDYVNLNGISANVSGVMFDVYGWFPILNNATLMTP